MSLIQKEIADFSVQCYQNNAFRTVTKADVLGKWSVFFFYPADFTFVCPTELEDLATSMINSRPSAAKFTPFPAIPTLSIRRGMTPPSVSRRSSIPCWPIPHIVWQRILRSTSKPTAWRSGVASLSTPREKSGL